MKGSWILVLLLGLLATPLQAEPTPVGTEFQVNQVTLGRQLNPAIAALNNGEAIVVWEGEDADGRGIFARRFNDLGGVGNEFQVSVTTTDDQTSADVAALPTGEFIVVWENEFSDPFHSSRRYTAAGVASSVVDLTTQQSQFDVFDPQIAAVGASNFVVVWESYDGVADSSAVEGRLLQSSGVPQGQVFDVERGMANEFVSLPSLSSRPGDGFVLSWRSDATDRELRARKYDASGNAEGAFVVAATDQANYPQSTSLSDDGFLVAWGETPDGLRRKRFAGDGTVGTEEAITPDIDLPRLSDAIQLPGERAALAWSQNSSSNPNRILVQIVTADDAVEADITVDETSLTVFRPRLAYDADRGELLVVWAKRGAVGGDQEDVFLRRYKLDFVDVIFEDGFEDGSTSAWIAVP